MKLYIIKNKKIEKYKNVKCGVYKTNSFKIDSYYFLKTSKQKISKSLHVYIKKNNGKLSHFFI